MYIYIYIYIYDTTIAQTETPVADNHCLPTFHLWTYEYISTVYNSLTVYESCGPAVLRFGGLVLGFWLGLGSRSQLGSGLELGTADMDVGWVHPWVALGWHKWIELQ